MAKRKVESQTNNLILDHYKLGIALIYLRASGVPHIVGMLLTRAIIFSQTSPQSKVYKKRYGPPNLRES
jgi:hypothetical protein